MWYVSLMWAVMQMEFVEGIITIVRELLSRFILFLPRLILTNPIEMLRWIL